MSEDKRPDEDAPGPSAPDTPDAPSAPDVPGPPDLPGPSADPEPGVPPMPEIPDPPDIPEPEIPDMPEIPGSPGLPGSSPDGAVPSGAEEALRQMLHASVEGIEPSAASLGRLHRAVPARRAHRRQAFAGAAAAVVLAGVGIPAMTHSSFVPGVGSNDRPLNASSSHEQTRSPDHTGNGTHEGAASSGSETAGTRDGGAQHDGTHPKPSPSASTGGDGGEADDTLSATVPRCGRGQLGDGSSRTGPPDAAGKVYGSFRVINTSEKTCAVEGAGLVGAETQRSSSRIQVVDHTSGDAASGLPDPAAEADRLVLRAGDSYTVRFAWVPDGCPLDGPVPDSGSGTGETGDAEGPSGGSEGQDGGGPGIPETGGGESGGSDAGSGGDTPGNSAGLRLVHTPDAGDPAAADTELAGAGACTGTVYRTGVLADG